MTRINPDDPKWTAYILDELGDAERAAVELELESSQEARTLVEELRFAADLTKTELRAEGVVRLTPEQREAIQASVSARPPRPWFIARPAFWGAGLAAASIALMVALAPPLMRMYDSSGSRPAALFAPLSAGAQERTSVAPAATRQPELAPEAELRYRHAALPPASETVPARIAESPAGETAEAAPGVPAQSDATGRVFGTVEDATAARIPGVTITATNTQTGTMATAVTNESGNYVLDGLQTGTYRLQAQSPGFRNGVIDGVQLNANAQTQRDITLEVGQVSEAVQVAADTNAVLHSPSPSPAPAAAPPPPIAAPGEGGAAGRGVLDGRNTRQERQRLSGLRGGVLKAQEQAYAVLPTPPGTLPPPGRKDAPPLAPGVPSPTALDRAAPGVYNGTEAYNGINDNPFLSVNQNPLSTFSVDVDTASYSIVRRYINQNQLPPHDAVRIEEMINYFPYDYPQPSGNTPIGVTLEAAAAPWNPLHRLVRVGIKARDIDVRRRPASNLVFLLDVSGSMQPPERLPLLKDAIRMLVDQLTVNDRVTVITYAGTTGIALRPTRGDQKDTILGLINSLQAGGSTNGASGIQLAYEQAVSNFIPGGVNRVILATDGDFNVGITDRNALLRLIEDKAKTGVFLSVLGVGMGNYKDATLEILADKGHGNYAYLDTLNEAKKVLVEQMGSTLVTMAKDVKVQVEFNPAVVGAYRLIGYENRALRNEDFNNDLKDAGDMGAGHTVTVLYEVVPGGVGIDGPSVDPLKYQQPAPPPAKASNETLTVKVRYKEPSGGDSRLLVFPLLDREQAFARASTDFRFAAAVASFGMVLRDSPNKGTSAMNSVLNIAEDSLGSDRNGYRREFLQLVQRARQVRGR